jgi:8-oxo-dGTP pyrophosphatase MutT (NUDIX family)
MSYRAAIVLIENGQVALIERHRQGLHYFTFPGGHMDPGEAPEQAAVRETEEELGLQVVVKRLLAEIWWHGKPQYYYLVEANGGNFGTGIGEELLHPLPDKGTYRPLWTPVRDLLDLPVLPRSMAQIVVEAQSAGWPDPVPVLRDDK